MARPDPADTESASTGNDRMARPLAASTSTVHGKAGNDDALILIWTIGPTVSTCSSFTRTTSDSGVELFTQTS